MIYAPPRRRQLAAALGAVVAVVVAAGAALAASAFNDVADDHPASAEITAAHQVGVFQGYGDGTFRPDGKLTRGQAELVIQRMLTWQGTDDDGNFEISRADAAVLAMSGLCGLDPDRIPACAVAAAAASEAEVQAAYDRGYDDGINDASTGSTPPPVTAPTAPATAAERCDAHMQDPVWGPPGLRLGAPEATLTMYQDASYNGTWTTPRHTIWPRFGPNSELRNVESTSYGWIQRYAADFEDGQVCGFYTLGIQDFPSYPAANRAGVYFAGVCWVTRIDPVSGLEHELGFTIDLSDEITPASQSHAAVLRGAIAGDRPSPDHWSAHNPADCLTSPGRGLTAAEIADLVAHFAGQ